MDGRKIVYVYSGELRKESDRLPSVFNRASIVQDLINAYKLLHNDQVTVMRSLNATEDDLKIFHASNFVNFLKKVNDEESFENHEEELKEFGLNYLNPILPKHFDLVKTVAGGSITGAKLLACKQFDVAINWFGGWHHAQRYRAEGFCYVNDIVLAIHKLSGSFRKILYVDFDVHHGDGVQNAFELSKNVLTLSFHKLGPGFYPGTGRLEDIGSSNGKYYSINVPFLGGFSSKTFLKVFFLTFPEIYEAFKPDAMVVQCGADSLNGDKIGESNLVLTAIGKCVEHILKCKVPVLFLGGGGYNSANTARLWTYLTSIITGQNIDDDIPDCAEFFTEYAPSYELHIDEGKQKDMNSDDYVAHLINTILSYVKFIE